MLKLVCFKKLKEDYPDIKLKMELPGGLDINRVTLPIILNCPQLPDQSQTQIQIETEIKFIRLLFKVWRLSKHIKI